jgi:hypothetical protein
MYLNGSEVGGVQSMTVAKNAETTTIIKKGSPTVVKNFYKRPNVDVSFTKFLSNTAGAYFPGGFNLLQRPPQTFVLEAEVVGGGGLKFVDMILKSASYKFSNQGFFSETLTFNGSLLEGRASISARPYEMGTTYRRQDYNKSGSSNPAAVSALLAGGHALLSTEVSFNANYGDIPTYGNFYSVKSKYLSFPVDVSCTYEVLDRGYTHSGSTYGNDGNNFIYDTVSNESIIIGGPPTINLGSNNFLVNIDRSGGEAGQGDYSIFKFTYRNNDGSFTIS